MTKYLLIISTAQRQLLLDALRIAADAVGSTAHDLPTHDATVEALLLAHGMSALIAGIETTIPETAGPLLTLTVG